MRSAHRFHTMVQTPAFPSPGATKQGGLGIQTAYATVCRCSRVLRSAQDVSGGTPSSRLERASLTRSYGLI